MHCDRTDRWTLLSETGELSTGEQQMLDEHLAGCPRCAHLRAETLGAMELARKALPTGDPGARVHAALRAAAAARVGTGKRLVFRHPALQVLAYAACLAAALGIWFRISGRTAEDHVEVTRAILVSISEEVYDSREAGEAAGETDELRALARELLIMEGMAADDVGSLDLLWEASGDASPRTTTSVNPLDLRTRAA